MGKNELEAYREAEVRGASAVELVIMLCDVLSRDLQRVIAAIQAGKVEERVNESNHAFEVLQQLEALLDMEHGGSTARDLSRVYSHIRAKVMEAQFRLEPAILRKQIELILQLRQDWQRAMVAVSTPLSPEEKTLAAAGAAGNRYSGTVEEVRCCGWSA
jgi:flagellar biosynthetic protein FliS